jgi:2-polyprenyl-3-methyl-5-hydroxy-6-metoxy-1,4-benzoquinol methylase
MIPMVSAYAHRPDGKFDLVTCFEALEHVPDPVASVALVVECVAEPGVILYSTVIQPADFNYQCLAWAYVAPRNGHKPSTESFGFLPRVSHQNTPRTSRSPGCGSMLAVIVTPRGSCKRGGKHQAHHSALPRARLRHARAHRLLNGSTRLNANPVREDSEPVCEAHLQRRLVLTFYDITLY